MSKLWNRKGTKLKNDFGPIAVRFVSMTREERHPLHLNLPGSENWYLSKNFILSVRKK